MGRLMREKCVIGLAGEWLNGQVTGINLKTGYST